MPNVYVLSEIQPEKLVLNLALKVLELFKANCQGHVLIPSSGKKFWSIGSIEQN